MNAPLRPIVRFTGDLFRGTARQTERLARSIANGAVGVYRDARQGSTPKPDMDDVTLARKVETELFRPRGAPKGSVDINVVEGVVYLRGEVKRPAQIKSLEARVRTIPEVRGVENLLHLPKTPSPTRADSPRRAQKNPPSPKPRPRKRTTATRTRVTAEAPAPTAEQPPGTRATTRSAGGRSASGPSAGGRSASGRSAGGGPASGRSPGGGSAGGARAARPSGGTSARRSPGAGTAARGSAATRRRTAATAAAASSQPDTETPTAASVTPGAEPGFNPAATAGRSDLAPDAQAAGSGSPVPAAGAGAHTESETPAPGGAGDESTELKPDA